MRAMLVIPIDKINNLTPKLLASLRNQDASNAFVLHRKNETLDHGDASVLADGPIARRLDAFALNPTAERFAVEDAVAVWWSTEFLCCTKLQYH